MEHNVSHSPLFESGHYYYCYYLFKEQKTKELGSKMICVVNINDVLSKSNVMTFRFSLPVFLFSRVCRDREKKIEAMEEMTMISGEVASQNSTACSEKGKRKTQ